MLTDHFPLLGLRLRTPRLELRLPDGEELAALAELAAEGVHAPDAMPFFVPWTDGTPAEVARSVVHHHWRQLGAWSPQEWTLPLAVFRDGEVVGLQSLGARQFALTREVSSGSWLGLRHHGQGVGTEMRAAVLHLAFAGLGAEAAHSGAFTYNAASLGVSRRLGYQPNGTQRLVVRGAPVTEQRLRLTRDDWQRHRTVPVTLDGLAPCLPHLAADASAPAGA